MTEQALVHVVDDDEELLDSVKDLLQFEGFAVQDYISAEAFLSTHLPLRPGCLILDIRMSGKSGLELQSLLAERECPLPIVFLTGHGAVPTAVQAMKLGACDFLEKPVDNDRLIKSVRAAVEASKARIRAALARETLTTRERDVADLICKGKINKAIADELGIAEKTVEFHRANVLRKLRVSSAADLIDLCTA